MSVGGTCRATWPGEWDDERGPHPGCGRFAGHSGVHNADAPVEADQMERFWWNRNPETWGSAVYPRGEPGP